MIDTAKLQAEYDEGVEQIRAIRERIEPLKVELSKRHNARVLVLNQVMNGQGPALVEAGVLAEVVAEAEAWVASERARKKAKREANPLSPEEQALAMLHPSDPGHAEAHAALVGGAS